MQGLASDNGAAGALLWMTHALLCEKHWAPRGEVASHTHHGQLPPLGSFAGDVNLLPTVRYMLPAADTTRAAASERNEEEVGEDDVHVRALVVGRKLFVHFVSHQKTMRVALTITEYVKLCTPHDALETEVLSPNARILRVGKWRCNLETLRWRLERNLFPEFAVAGEGDTSRSTSLKVAVAMPAAELSRLPEPLLLRIGSFLRASELSHLTQTSKYLRRLHNAPELWRQFLSQDFPMVVMTDDPKTRYTQLFLQQQQRVRVEGERWLEFHRERQLGNFERFLPSLYGRWRGGGWLLAPPLYLPLTPPFLPPGSVPWPLRQPHPTNLYDDDELELFPDALSYPHGPELGLHFY